MSDDFDHDEFSRRELAYIAWRRTLSWEIQDVEDQIETLRITADHDKEQFVKFGLGFVEDVAKEFLEISYEERMRCKELLFPAGFRLNAAGKVYTPEVSIIYRVAATKKDAEASNNSLMVRVRGL